MNNLAPSCLSKGPGEQGAHRSLTMMGSYRRADVDSWVILLGLQQKSRDTQASSPLHQPSCSLLKTYFSPPLLHVLDSPDSLPSLAYLEIIELIFPRILTTWIPLALLRRQNMNLISVLGRPMKRMHFKMQFKEESICFLVLFGGVGTPSRLKVCFCFCSQESLLAGLGRP